MPLYRSGGSASSIFDFVAGENLAQYEVVYGDAAGGLGRVKKAINTAEATSRVVGVVTAAALTGATVKVMTLGQYKLKFAGAPVVGDFGKPVFLAGVAGQVTLTPPGAGTVLIRLGYLAGWGAADSLVDLKLGDEFVQ
jgi:hypothetical protein